MVAIPASFGTFQREELLGAARIANLDVSLCSSTLAVAAQYAAMERKLHHPESTKLVLIMNLGARWSEVGVVQMSASSLKVLAVGATRGHGGESITEALMSLVRDRADLPTHLSPDELQELREECEKAVKQLADCSQATITHPNQPIIVKRADLERIGGDLVGHLEDLIRRVVGKLSSQNVSVDSFGDILLVGGVSFDPVISNCMERMLQRPMNKSFHAKETVALGCARLANPRSFEYIDAADVAY